MEEIRELGNLIHSGWKDCCQIKITRPDGSSVLLITYTNTNSRKTTRKMQVTVKINKSLYTQQVMT